MDLPHLTSMSVRDISEELTKLEIQELEIPKFSIPNWPAGVNVGGCLGKRDYRVPVLQSNNLLLWKTGRHKISFWISQKGDIGFKFHLSFGRKRIVFYKEWDYEDVYEVRDVCSNHNQNNVRLATVVLFDQFKVDILLKILPELKNNSQIHNQVIKEVEKAFEPFIPFIVIDKLTS